MNTASVGQEKPAPNKILKLKPKKPQKHSISSSPESIHKTRGAENDKENSATTELPHPLSDPENQKEIDRVASSVGEGTAGTYLSLCLYRKLKYDLPPGAYDRCMEELGERLSDYIKSQLEWAANELWYEAKNYQKSERESQAKQY